MKKLDAVLDFLASARGIFLVCVVLIVLVLLGGK